MIVVGLTGSIGMGKTETAKLFARSGVPVFDADACVHALYAPGGAAVGPIGELFPDVIVEGAVDRQKLAQVVLDNPDALRKLEALVHPLVRDAEQKFLGEAEASGVDIVVLDIPLLFETTGPDRVDKVVVTTAPEAVQRARVLERPGMTAKKLDAILSKQMPDTEKRAKADFVVETDKGLDDAYRQVNEIVNQLRAEIG